MVESKKVKEWVMEVFVRFSKVKQFVESTNYVYFTDWYRDALEDLGNTEGGESTQGWVELLYNDLVSILNSARNDIEWTGKASTSFDDHYDNLIYPEAWNLWNAKKYNIQTNLFSSCRERGNLGEEIFYFDLHDDSPPLDISIPITRLSVTPGAMVYVGNCIASTLHLICDVPAIPDDLTASQTVERVLDPNLERNQWQRALISNRVKHIQSFLHNGDSYFVNPVIIHLDEFVDSSYAKIELQGGQSFLKVNLQSILDGNMLEGDKRPLKLIDGQHRVRGAARSSMGNVLEIPFILIPTTYAPDHAAKLFTEINTTSKELDKDHQLFLAYRFKIAHHDVDITMSDADNDHDRANRMAYRMAAKLSSEGSSLESQIQMLKSNGTTNCVEIVKWLKYAKKWFLPNGPYEPYKNYDEDYIVEELENYFSAWISTIGESWIANGAKGWTQRTIFQQKTHFRVLLTRFMQIHSMTRSRVGDEMLSEADFLETLMPLKNMKSDSLELKKAYHRTSEFYWQCMDAWVEDAIENGTEYSEEDVMSASIRSQPGKGILSPPAIARNWSIEDDPNGNWPDNKSRYLSLIRPTNCHKTVKIQILNGEEVLTGISRNKINSPNQDGIYRVPIRSGLIPDDIDEIKVRLEWKNAISTLERTVTIRKPD